MKEFLQDVNALYNDLQILGFEGPRLTKALGSCQKLVYPWLLEGYTFSSISISSSGKITAIHLKPREKK